ncbi:MAG: hypothetical protein IT454_02840 [Planctomycetes bacterium]|nr:hypothetical protein [Planctomycetota bacterium]
MVCHNGSLDNDYAGPGIENPHPFDGASTLSCSTCHGGNPEAETQLAAHVPPPPEIGDDAQLLVDREAYFNRLTLAGIDKFDDYTVDGVTYTALDYLQFINPGDLRVVTLSRGCGQCHENHAEDVAGSLLATEAGIFSGASFAIGLENKRAPLVDLYQDTASEYSFRAVDDANFGVLTPAVGDVDALIEYPVYSKFGDAGANAIFNNNAYLASALDDDIGPDRRVIDGSPLANLFHEQVSFTCGDCHLGSAGANNRAGDFRSSGCTACHMAYSLGGRSGSNDPLVDKLEPLDPDDIDEPERPHPRAHRIASVAKTTTSGASVPGIDDHTCAGCHQGSNRTVMQYWGIRLDQNADVRNHRQYPANPVTSTTTHADTRLFDPAVGNHTFNGRNGNQYLLKEDYDGDGRDDTPEDVHYQAGLGCIDCHGSFDLHGGDTSTPGTELSSRMEQQTAIRCENCHGTIDAYAVTQSGTAYDGTTKDLALDSKGNLLDHVFRAQDGSFYLRSRLTGLVHYLPQTHDVTVDTGKVHPTSNQPLYSAKASYAMGRADSDPSNGIGPHQNYGVTAGFSHTDQMDCASCHASWTNTCMGCHLGGEYNTGANYSNITGERIVYKQTNADFTYQSPLYFQLGVNAKGKITQFSANTKVFYHWEDKNNQLSQVFWFADRNGGSSNPGSGFPSLSHNAFMAHSIRGKVDSQREGPRYCVACHMTTEALANYGAQYDSFRSAMQNADWAALDFQVLKQHFGQNPGNQLNSPLYPHMVAGLGTGLFLFDDQGAPVNPLDTNPNRVGAGGIAPSTNFSAARVRLNLDRIVEPSGVTNGSSNHAWLTPNAGSALRDGANDPSMAGPLGETLIRKLTDPATGIVLDSWIDANGASQGSASTYVGGP